MVDYYNDIRTYIENGDEGVLNNLVQKTDFSKDFLIERLKLPIYQGGKNAPILQIVDRLNKDILVVKAKTGSGKTSQIPTFLYESGKITGKIVCTQPRILTTKNSALNASKILGTTLGKIVGYRAEGTKKESEETSVYYMTEGTLLMMMLNNEKEVFNEFGAIILDEVHENTKEMNLLLAILNKKKRNIKIIITSATLDEEKYLNYFGLDREHFIESEGITQEIREEFLDENTENYLKDVMIKISKLNENTSNGEKEDILLFLPKIKDINLVEKGLKEICMELGQNDFSIVKLYRGTPLSEEEKIRKNINDLIGSCGGEKGKVKRRIILATNIAETGITFPDLKYIIDSGYEKVVIFEPYSNSTGGFLTPIIKNSAEQRRGRVGRKFEGNWFPLYTKEIYEKMSKNAYPKYLSENFNNTMLNIMKITRNFDEFNFIDHIPMEIKQVSFRELLRNGFVDKNGVIQFAGNLMLDLQENSIENIKCLIESFFLGCTYEISMLLAFSKLENAENLINSEKFNDELGYKSDHLYIISLLKEFKRQDNIDQKKKLCSLKNVDYNIISNLDDLFMDTLISIKNKKLPIESREENVRECLKKSYRRANLSENFYYYIIENDFHKGDREIYAYVENSFIYKNVKKYGINSYIKNLNVPRRDWRHKKEGLQSAKKEYERNESIHLPYDANEILKAYLPKKIIFSTLQFSTTKLIGAIEHKIDWISEIEL